MCLFVCLRVQVEVIKKAYLQGEVEFQGTQEEEDDGEEEHDAASPRNVGHNIYILAHQVFSHTTFCRYFISVSNYLVLFF